MTRPAASVALALALALAGGALPAQTMRGFTTARQLHGESRLAAHLDYGSGSLHIAPGAASGDLYRMRLWYDAERFSPTSSFEPATGTVRLALGNTGAAGLRIASRERLDEQTAVLTLSPQVALALDLHLGAVDGDIELGGLQLTELALATAASRTTVRFSRPNAARCTTASVSAGAADISIFGLGNSRCQQVRFEGGIGKAMLDLTGAWPAGASVNVRMAVGALTLRLPRTLGIRLTMDRFLSSFPSEAWNRQGAAYMSVGYAKASRHIDIALTSAIGGVNVEWVD